MMFPLISVPDAPEADTGKALNLTVGAVSPLWFLYAGAATAGMAYWWMTRWPTLAMSMAPTHLEAKLAEVMPDLPAPSPEPTPEPALAAPPIVTELAEPAPVATLIPEPAVIEAAVEPVLEPVPEPAPASKSSKAKATPPAEEPPPITH